MFGILPYYFFVAMRLHEEFRGKKFLIIGLGFEKAKVFVLESEQGEKFALDVTARFAELFTEEEDEERFKDGYLVGDYIIGTLLHRCHFFDHPYPRPYIIHLF